MKYLTLSALSILFFLTRSFTQNCPEWATTLADARFYDTNLVIVLSPDYDQLLYPVNPPIKPGFIHVTKNMLHGAPAGNIPKHIEMLKDELLNESLYLSNDEFKELFLRKMAVLIFFEFANTRNIETSLIQILNNLKADENDLISQQAWMVHKLYEFYLNKADQLIKWKRPGKSNANSSSEDDFNKDDWIRVFWKYMDCWSVDLIETYDKGYIVLATIRPVMGSERWTWIIKTDINGEILWDKKIGDGIHVSGLHDIQQTEDGGYILSGATFLLDSWHGDTFFMKLNACGEKEWCRIFHHAGPTDSYDFGLNIYPVPGEDAYIALVIQWGDNFVPPFYKGIWLFKLDNGGNPLWMKNIFDEVHPNAWNEIPKHMLVSKFLAEEGKHKVIITVWPIYNDYGLPYGYDKTMICAADTDGNELWWAIHYQDESYWSDPEKSIEDKYGNIYTVGRSDCYEDPLPGYYPALFKTDKDGNKIFQKYIIDSTFKANSFSINILNDTIFDIGGVWEYADEIDYAAIARTDTNGNLIMEKKVLQTEFGLNESIKTFDNKELFAGSVMENNLVKIYLHKFNSNLEYDTIYTQPFEYDYKCENLPIVSDTIGIDDCDVWTGLPGEIEYRMAQYLVIYPNPAENEITIKLPVATADERQWGPMTSRHFNHCYHNNSLLRIYDIFGRLINEIPLKDLQGDELKQDVSAYTSGIYLINLFENQKLMASGKFVKK